MKRRELIERGMVGAGLLVSGAVPVLAALPPRRRPTWAEGSPAVPYHLWFPGEVIRLYPREAPGTFRLMTFTEGSPGKVTWEDRYRLVAMNPNRLGVWEAHSGRYLVLRWADREGQYRDFFLQQPVALKATWEPHRDPRDGWSYLELRPGGTASWENPKYREWAESLLWGRPLHPLNHAPKEWCL